MENRNNQPTRNLLTLARQFINELWSISFLFFFLEGFNCQYIWIEMVHPGDIQSILKTAIIFLFQKL